MPFYQRLGDIPAKRHVTFRREGGALLFEHLMGNLGFTGQQSLLYTIRRPTNVKHIETAWRAPREAAESDGVRPIVFNTLVNPDSVDVIRKSNNPGELKTRILNAKKGVFDDDDEDEDDDDDY